MVSDIEIIESVFDTFQVERIFVAEANGAPELHAMVSGVECLVDAKPSHLAAGLAFCEPKDSRLAQDWPIYTDVRINGREERWWKMTNHAEIVSAVRRFQEQALAGNAEAGTVL